MPIYSYSCGNCQYNFEETKTIAERNEPTTRPCPKCGETSVVKNLATPPLVDPVRLGRKKPDEGFRDVLRNIKARNHGSMFDV